MWELGSAIFTEAISGSKLFGNGAILTTILIVVTVLLISRDQKHWGPLSLPVASMYIFILGTTVNFYWGALIVIIAAIIWLLTNISPSLSRISGVNTTNIRSLGKAITGKHIDDRRIIKRKEQALLKQIIEQKRAGTASGLTVGEIQTQAKLLASKKGYKLASYLDDKRQVKEIFAKTKEKQKERLLKPAVAKKILADRVKEEKRLQNTTLQKLIPRINMKLASPQYNRRKKADTQKKIKKLTKGKAQRMIDTINTEYQIEKIFGKPKKRKNKKTTKKQIYKKNTPTIGWSGYKR